MSSEPSEPAGPERRGGRLRLVLLPLVLIVGITAIVYAVARARPLEKGAPAPSGTVALGDAASGRTLFLAKCAGCHGTKPRAASGRSSRAAGSRCRPPRDDRVGRGVMPAGLVSGREESDVLAYLDTILGGGGTTGGAPATTAPATTGTTTTGGGAGDAARGAATFASTCSGCHGDGGAGGVAPRLRGASIGVDDARTIITNGRDGMPAGLVERRGARGRPRLPARPRLRRGGRGDRWRGDRDAERRGPLGRPARADEPRAGGLARLARGRRRSRGPGARAPGATRASLGERRDDASAAAKYGSPSGATPTGRRSPGPSTRPPRTP